MFQAKIVYDPESRKTINVYSELRFLQYDMDGRGVKYKPITKKRIAYQQWFYNAMREYRKLKAEYAFVIGDNGIVLTINQ